MLKISSQILQKVFMILNEKEEIPTIEYNLQRAGVSGEDYIKCLKVACRGRTVILK